MKKKITPKDFSRLIQDKLSPFLSKKITKSKLAYETLTAKDRDAALLKIISVLRDDSVPFSGAHRFSQWEKGWKENLDGYLENLDEKFLVPKYYGKYDIVRLRGDFVRAASPDFESNMISLIVYWAAEKYLKSVSTICEFGCGPGHNLLKFRELFPETTLYGLDWVESSQKTIEAIAKQHGDNQMFGRKFDYFHPDTAFKLPAKTGIITMASLEQTGDNYKKFVDYILKNKPDIVVNIEPMAELLDPGRLPDYLSIEYFKKRKYLNGYVDYLRNLETKKKIKIINAQRTNSGSLFVDGHSLIAWKTL